MGRPLGSKNKVKKKSVHKSKKNRDYYLKNNLKIKIGRAIGLHTQKKYIIIKNVLSLGSVKFLLNKLPTNAWATIERNRYWTPESPKGFTKSLADLPLAFDQRRKFKDFYPTVASCLGYSQHSIEDDKLIKHSAHLEVNSLMKSKKISILHVNSFLLILRNAKIIT